MANPFLGVRIPPELNEALLVRMRETGQSKSEIVVDALRIYLRMAPQQDRLDSVEERLSALELELGILPPRSAEHQHAATSDSPAPHPHHHRSRKLQQD